MQYREAYPTWMLMGMDVLAAGILLASFRDAWWVVSSLGKHAGDWYNSIVAGAVVLAIDASILLLEQTRSQVKLRGGATILNDIWVTILIVLSAVLNVRYLTSTPDQVEPNIINQWIGGILGVAIPSTIAVLGYLKGNMLAYNARLRMDDATELARHAHHQELPVHYDGNRAREPMPSSQNEPVSPAEVPLGVGNASSSPHANSADEAHPPLFRLKR